MISNISLDGYITTKRKQTTKIMKKIKLHSSLNKSAREQNNKYKSLPLKRID